MVDVSKKIVSLEELGGIANRARAGGKIVVLCHGVFDLLHIGHIRYLQRAKEMGDLLCVTLTADAYVNKGPNRPAFNQELRLEALAALEFVDHVAINDAASAVSAIEAIRPHKYIKGKDYKERPKGRSGNLLREEEAVTAYGGEMVFTEEDLYSSSSLINTHFNTLPEEVGSYIKNIRGRVLSDEIDEVFDAASQLRVLVIGELIVDEYHYCEAIGKSGKEPVLVARERSCERFAGGALAVANNVAGFCKEVCVVSHLGMIDPHDDFFRAALLENVRLEGVPAPNRPTIIKRRFVENYLLQKLFETYQIEDGPLTVEEEQPLLEKLQALLPNFDLVIVTDYGHGMLNKNVRDLISKHSRYLAVNTQANAGNNGFHTISVYPRADYISISFSELCLEMRKRYGELKEMLPILRERVECDQITVTKGKEGIFVWTKGQEFAYAPAMTQHFVDRVGSGDAVLAVTSPLSALKVDPELIAFLGNLAGAEAVRTVGHRSFLTRSRLMKIVKSLLK